MNSLGNQAAVSNFSAQFSTEGLDLRDQFDAWREQLSLRFGLAEVSRKAAGTFRATIETLSLSKLSMSVLAGDAMTFERMERHVALRDRDEFTVGLLVKGSAVVEQDDRSTSLSPGDLVLCDCLRPFRIRFDEPFQQIVFRCDRAEIEARVPNADRHVAERIGGRAALPSATANYIASVAKQAADFGPAEVAIAQHSLEILAFTLGGLSPQDRASQVLLSRIHCYIEENLSNPALTPATIARYYRISRRQLYRLFDGSEDSVAGLIRRRRLARSKAMLADELHMKSSISEIAFACGFNDGAAFARAFRAAFRKTPRAYRRSINFGLRGSTRAQLARQ